MASIGSIFYEFRGDGARLKADAKKEGEAAGAIAGKGFAGKMKASMSGMKGGLMAGLGLGAGLGAIGVATAAVGKFTQVLGDATQAAIADEESQSRLAASLKANVPNWDGNTDAIEANILAKQRLGFEDETLRDSMTVLVGATHDVTKAQNIMNVAMDLARFKGIDLKTASEALIKVEGGVFRSLKQLGIKLKDNATSTEALAAVQAVASGQAEAYADTNAGKLVASQIRVDEVMERLGTVTMPILVELMGQAADAIESVATAFDGTSDAAGEAEGGLSGLGDMFSDLSERGNESKTVVGEVDESLTNLLDDLLDFITPWDRYTLAVEDQAAAQRDLTAAAKDTDTSLGILAAAGPPVGVVLEDLGETADESRRKLTRMANDAATSFESYKDRAINAARDIIDKAYQMIEDKAALTAVNVEKADLRKILSTRKWTAEEKLRYEELTNDQVNLMLDLAENGAEQQAIFKDNLVLLEEELKTATGNRRKEILAAITALKNLAKEAKRTAAVIDGLPNPTGSGANTRGGSTGGATRRHSGGPVAAGQPYVWKPQEELFVPNVAGQVKTMANVQASGGASMSAVAPNINVSLLDRMPVESVRDIGAGLRMLGEQGYLTPRRK